MRSLQQAWRERKRILSSTNITATTSDTVPIGNHKLSTVPKNSSGIVVDTFEGDVFPTLITSSIETMKASSLAPISEEMECECISVGSYDLDAFPFDDTMSRGSDKDHVTSNQQTETSNITNNSSSLFKIQPLDSNLSYSSSSYGMIMDDSIVTGAQISKPIDVHISSTVPTTNDDTDRGIAATPILSSTNTSTKEMFSNLRRQAIASMVIQRNLVRFWRDKNK